MTPYTLFQLFLPKGAPMLRGSGIPPKPNWALADNINWATASELNGYNLGSGREIPPMSRDQVRPGVGRPSGAGVITVHRSSPSSHPIPGLTRTLEDASRGSSLRAEIEWYNKLDNGATMLVARSVLSEVIVEHVRVWANSNRSDWSVDAVLSYMSEVSGIRRF